MKLNVIRTASRNSQVTVSDDVFAKPNEVLLAQAIRVYLSNQRQGTAKTQTRSDVNRTTRKWYRQKGTGNARHGARDANIFVGGAVSHGPTGEQNWKKDLTPALKKQALAAALTAQASNIMINDEILELKGKTKEAHKLLADILVSFDESQLEGTKLLVVIGEKKDELERALRNIPQVKVLKAGLINALAVAQADKIILTSEAQEIIEQRIGA